MSLPPDLLETFDRASEKTGYQDRSKALQAAMRAFVSESGTSLKTGNIVGSIVLIYNHDTKGTDEAITETSHLYRQSILSSLHAHIDAAHCLLALLVRGKAQEITALEALLKRQKGIMQVKASYMKTESV